MGIEFESIDAVLSKHEIAIDKMITILISLNTH